MKLQYKEGALYTEKVSGASICTLGGQGELE